MKVMVGGGTTVNVADGMTVVGVAGAGVALTTMTMGLGDGRMAVAVGTGERVTGVMVGSGVNDAASVGPGVMKMGAPTSLQPRSGAAPA